MGATTSPYSWGNGAGGFSAAPGSPIAVGLSQLSPWRWGISTETEFRTSPPLMEKGLNVTKVPPRRRARGVSARRGAVRSPSERSRALLAVGDFNGDGIQDLAYRADLPELQCHATAGERLRWLQPGAGKPVRRRNESFRNESLPRCGGRLPTGMAELTSLQQNNTSSNVTVLLGELAPTGSVLSLATASSTVAAGTSNPPYSCRIRFRVQPTHRGGDVSRWDNGSGRGDPDDEPVQLLGNRSVGWYPHADGRLWRVTAAAWPVPRVTALPSPSTLQFLALTISSLRPGFGKARWAGFHLDRERLEFRSRRHRGMGYNGTHDDVRQRDATHQQRSRRPRSCDQLAPWLLPCRIRGRSRRRQPPLRSPTPLP